MKKDSIAAICCIIAIILIITSIFLPWWYVKVDIDEDNYNGENRYKIYEITVEDNEGSKREKTYRYTDDDYKELDWVERFNVTLIFVILSIISSIVFLILILKSKSNPYGKKDSIYIIGTISIIYLILAPFFIMITLPQESGEFSDGEKMDLFWGSKDDKDMGVTLKYSWGAHIGWYLVVVALCLNIVGLIFIHKQIKINERKRRRRKRKKIENPCPNCSEELSYIDEFESWYCYNCEEYIE